MTFEYSSENFCWTLGESDHPVLAAFLTEQRKRNGIFYMWHTFWLFCCDVLRAFACMQLLNSCSKFVKVNFKWGFNIITCHKWWLHFHLLFRFFLFPNAQWKDYVYIYHGHLMAYLNIIEWSLCLPYTGLWWIPFDAFSISTSCADMRNLKIIKFRTIDMMK